MDLTTAIVTLASAIIGFSGALFKEHLAKSQERKTKELEWIKEYQVKTLAEPAILWIDETLAFMEIESRVLEFGTKPTSSDRIFAILEKSPAIRARIEAFNDTALSRAITELSESIFRFAESLGEKKIEKVTNELMIATKLAGIILKRLASGQPP